MNLCGCVGCLLSLGELTLTFSLKVCPVAVKIAPCNFQGQDQQLDAGSSNKHIHISIYVHYKWHFVAMMMHTQVG